MNKAAKEAADMARGAKRKRKMVAAAPAYLKSRVGRGEELPSIDINSSSSSSSSRHGRNEMMIAGVMEFVGEMSQEVFVELMERLVPEWDDARRA